MPQISLLGCGWLGLPLAEALLKEGCTVKASTTSPEKLEKLEASGLHPYLVTLSEIGISGSIHDFLEGTAVLIIDIPPKLRGEGKENFTAKIKNLVPEIEKAVIKKVLFVSSTSVYAEVAHFPIVTEETPPDPDSEAGRQLLEAEQLLQDCKSFKTTVLRFGGLVGEDRHPIKFLAGRKNIENPLGPINLIHRKDCIGIILKIIKEDIFGETFNAVAPVHPGRQDYYTKKALAFGLPAPAFSLEKQSAGKIIDSRKLMEVLDYQFHAELL
ncbi:MAG TPA: SDR family oxidoreductase [Flavobacterium sp.]|nr:SDR family oxidoreductase [Flavobacterium sp.]